MFGIAMGQIASKEARLTHPASDAFRKAKLLAQNYSLPFWNRWSGVDVSKKFDLLVSGSTARGAEEVHDLDLAVVFESRKRDFEGEQRDILRRLELAERLTHNRNGALAEVPTDLIPVPDKYFFDPIIRDYLNKMFKDPDFLFSLLDTSQRFDPATGDFIPADWSYFVREYGRK